MGAAVRGGRRRRAPRLGWLTPRQQIDVEWATRLYRRTGVALIVHGVQVGWQFRSVVGSQHEAEQQHSSQHTAQPQEEQEAQLDAGEPPLSQRQQRRLQRSSDRSKTHHVLQKLRQLVCRATRQERRVCLQKVKGPLKAARQYALALREATGGPSTALALRDEPAPMQVQQDSVVLVMQQDMAVAVDLRASAAGVPALVTYEHLLLEVGSPRPPWLRDALVAQNAAARQSRQAAGAPRAAADAAGKQGAKRAADGSPTKDTADGTATPAAASSSSSAKRVPRALTFTSSQLDPRAPPWPGP
jgi:hypothetical protein